MAPLSHPAFSILTTAVAAGIGYYIGKTSGLHKSEVIQDLQEKAKTSPAPLDNEFLPPSSSPPPLQPPSPPDSKAATDAEWVDSEDEGEGVSAFTEVPDDCKMVLVVRTDLGMTKGKIAAQCSHATLMCYKAASRYAPDLVRRWETYGQTKVAVQVKGGEEELLMLQAQALSLGVVAKIVHDAGRTQIASGSATVLGLGPAPRSVVDQISGGLKLL
ncbi:peptidyl-tRNA hydrolase PTH2-domain-containing protein [Trichophaea hybrida]|nr:peptidyl-tRNA hydrolase PTH2-domain-containing protein [Trichophaea hybrida]